MFVGLVLFILYDGLTLDEGRETTVQNLIGKVPKVIGAGSATAWAPPISFLTRASWSLSLSVSVLFVGFGFDFGFDFGFSVGFSTAAISSLIVGVGSVPCLTTFSSAGSTAPVKPFPCS